MATKMEAIGSRVTELGRHGLFGSLGGTILALLGVWVGLLGWGGAIPLVVVGAIGAIIAASAAALIARARALPQEAGHLAQQRGSYLMISRLEYLGFAAAIIVFGPILNRPQFVVPASAIISGIHYLALGRLFQMRSGYVRGALMCAIAVVTMLALPAQATLGASPAHTVDLWALVSGPACAVVLWPDAIVTLARGFRLARGARSSIPVSAG